MITFISRKIVTTVRSLPGRANAFHVINSPKGIEVLFKLAAIFLGQKIRKRVFIHDTLESLYKMVSRDRLPNEYGGKAGHIEGIAGKFTRLNCRFFRKRLIPFFRLCNKRLKNVCFL
jgi:hypothetical protein